MIRVGIRKEGQKGTIEYNSGTKEFAVDFPDTRTVSQINKYLTTKREFRIPESGKIDDYRIDNALPVSNETYFRLALSTLFVNVEVWVEW